jgi:hypothetical protein
MNVAIRWNDDSARIRDIRYFRAEGIAYGFH